MELKSFKTYLAESALKGLDAPVIDLHKELKTELQIADFLTLDSVVTEKLDGVKLILLRNKEEFDEDYWYRNWVVSLKGHIYYPEDYQDLDRETIKQRSVGTSQIRLFMDHLEKIHNKTRDISPNTVFLIEFLTNKSEEKLRYKEMHGMFLIGYADVEGYSDDNGRLRYKSDEFSTDQLTSYASLLEVNVPPVLFKGQLKDLPLGILSPSLKRAYEKKENRKLIDSKDINDKLEGIKKIFTEFESDLGGIPVGAIFDMESGERFTLDHELHVEQKDYDYPEAVYLDNIREYVKSLMELLNKKEYRASLKVLHNLIYNKNIPENLRYKEKSEIQIKDDMYYEAKKMFTSKLKGNNWVLIPGRFRVFTRAHKKMLMHSLRGHDGIVVALITDSETKIPEDLREEMILSNFGDLVEVVKIKVDKFEDIKLKDILEETDRNINSMFVGTDKYDLFKSQMKYNPGIELIETKRERDKNEDISASKAIETIENDDIEKFKLLTPEPTWDFFERLKKYI